jgi:hypothetical protein
MGIRNVVLELPSGDSLLEHFLEFEITTAFHFGEAEVKVDANDERWCEKYKGDFGAQVGRARIDQYWDHLTNQRSGQGCKHQVNRIGLLTHANCWSFTANRISRCPKCELILQFRVSEGGSMKNLLKTRSLLVWNDVSKHTRKPQIVIRATVARIAALSF